MKKNPLVLISQFLSGEEKSTEEQIHEWSSSETSSLEQIIYQPGSTNVVSPHVFTDLDWFTQQTDRPSILRSISRTQTPFGDIMMKECFESVLSDKTMISYRQEALRTLLHRPQLTNELKDILRTLENTSSDLTWFWKPDQEGEFQLLHDIVYFSLPLIGSYLNQNDMILNLLSTYRIFLTPLFCIITPLLTFLVPYFAMRRLGVEVTFSQVFHLLKNTVFTSSLIPPKTKFLAGLSVLVWVVFFVQNVYTNLKMASLSHNLTCILHKKLCALSKLAQATERMKSLLENSPLLKWLDPPTEEPPLELLHSCFEQEHGLFSAKGNVLATYTQVNSILEGYVKKSMRFLGRVDMVCSMVTYLQEVENMSLPWCFATFGAKYSLKDLWNPILYTKDTKPVPNTLSLGKKANVVLLTGPNAAGKSTFIRTIMINAILSQTFGIVLARKWSAPAPFTYMDTYMNVPDVEGHASLFEAEMYRCLEYLKRLEEHPQEPMLLVMDEIFSSTNYREGFSAAYSILRYLATTFPHLLGFVTTHFHGLTELENHSKGKIRNFCFDATKKDGKISYTYELHRGSSQAHLALEILEQNGIGHEILRIANQVYTTLDNPKLPAFI